MGLRHHPSPGMSLERRCWLQRVWAWFSSFIMHRFCTLRRKGQRSDGGYIFVPRRFNSAAFCERFLCAPQSVFSHCTEVLVSWQNKTVSLRPQGVQWELGHRACWMQGVVPALTLFAWAFTVSFSTSFNKGRAKAAPMVMEGRMEPLIINKSGQNN